MADGNVRGWSDRSEALVLCLPTPEPDRFQVVALTTGNTPEETARLGVAIVAHFYYFPQPIIQKPDPNRSERRKAARSSDHTDVEIGHASLNTGFPSFQHGGRHRNGKEGTCREI